MRQGIGRRTDVKPPPPTAAPHDITVESLGPDLLEQILRQGDDFRALQTDFRVLQSSNTELLGSVNKLTSSNAQLLGEVNGLKLEVNGLKLSNTELLKTLQRYTKTMSSLNRCMVLDDARTKIAKVYSLTLDGLWSQHTDIKMLVRQIRSKLSAEHSILLDDDALRMIYDSSDGSIRHDGNKAAHEAPLSDRIDSVLDGRLTMKQGALLRNIYRFAHDKEPQFEV